MLPVLLLFVWGAALGLNADTFWFDEVGSLYYAGGIPNDGPQTLPEVIASQLSEDLEDETNPPGYYIALHLWVRVFGSSEFAVRLLSLMAGVLALAFVYRVGQDIASPEVGLAAAVVLGTCAFYITYMHEARSYAIYSMLVALSLWAYHRLITMRNPTVWLYALLVVGIAGLMYIHYLSSMFLVAAALYHLLLVPKNARWWRVTGAVLIAGLLFIPWLGFALRSFGHVSGNEARELFALPLPALLGELLTQFGNQNPALVLVLLIAAVPMGNRLTWFLLVVTLALTAVANEFVGFVSDVHYLMAVFPLLALVVAQGVVCFRAGGVLILVVWALAGVWFTLRPQSPLDDWHWSLPWGDVATMVGDPIQIDDKVIFHVPDPDPSWIHRRSVNYYLDDLVATVSLVESHTRSPSERHMNNLRDYIEPPARFWLVQNTAAPPSVQGIIERDRLFTQEGIAYCGVEQIAGTMQARLFLDTPAPEALPTFADGVRVGLAPWSPTMLGTSQLEFMLATGLDDDIDHDQYETVLYVEDGAGNRVQEHTAPLPADRRGCVHMVLDVSQFGDQPYNTFVQVRDRSTGTFVAPADSDVLDAEGRLLLFPIQIAQAPETSDD